MIRKKKDDEPYISLLNLAVKRLRGAILLFSQFTG
jgi:hypothetical protein